MRLLKLLSLLHATVLFCMFFWDGSPSWIFVLLGPPNLYFLFLSGVRIGKLKGREEGLMEGIETTEKIIQELRRCREADREIVP